ncbi:MAG: hypothetical protein RMH97_09720 [Verrucomicrobiales bacterium]|nr:hypothetical protein [Verrucomicrobiales bacterium]
MSGLLITALFAAVCCRAIAQVSVEIKLDQEQYLPGETVRIAVRITNFSGQTLRLGETPDWLAISVESRDGFIVPKTGEIPVVGPFTLPSAHVATKRVELTPYLDLSRPARYSVIATVQIPEWDQAFSSAPVTFDIVEGAKLWEREFGVPTTNGPPEVRKYTLQQVNYLKQVKLYVRVTDASGAKVHRVLCLGPLASFGHPRPAVDKLSNLHVLFQSGARSFLYCVVNPDGDLVKCETYDYAATRPRLMASADGDVTVVGGVRRPARNAPAGAVTNAPGTNKIGRPTNGG